jgi:hypothetical protein
MKVNPDGIILESGNGHLKTNKSVLVPWKLLQRGFEGMKWENLDTSGGTSAVLNSTVEVDSYRNGESVIICREWGADYEGTPWEEITEFTILSGGSHEEN